MLCLRRVNFTFVFRIWNSYVCYIRSYFVSTCLECSRFHVSQQRSRTDLRIIIAFISQDNAAVYTFISEIRSLYSLTRALICSLWLKSVFLHKLYVFKMWKIIIIVELFKSASFEWRRRYTNYRGNLTEKVRLLQSS